MRLETDRVPGDHQVGDEGRHGRLSIGRGPRPEESATNTLGDASAPNADVCAAGRSFFKAVLALDRADEIVILRYMTTVT